MKNLTVVFFALLLLVPSLTLAASVKKGAPGCATADLLDQFMKALIDNDEQTGESLLKGGCIILNQDVNVDILQTTADKVQVRVTKGDASLDMWVPIRALQQ